MKTPKQYTNDELALHIELWVVTNNELTPTQVEFFDEVVWRLLMTADKKQENTSGPE